MIVQNIHQITKIKFFQIKETKTNRITDHGTTLAIDPIQQ